MYEIYSKLLQERGLTSYRVAKECGMSQSSLSDWKRGKSKPKHEKMLRIAELFGVPVEYIETGVMPEESIKKEPTLSDGLLSERELAAFQEYLKLSESAKTQAQSFVHNLLISESH